LLLPLGLAFGAAAALRRSAYRRGVFAQARLPAPVISVGNLSVGGSGKTPLVAWIAERLLAASLPVAILSRGYAGSFAGECLIVSDGERLLADAEQAGDEPVMLARGLRAAVVAVGPRRDVVGQAVLARFGRRVLLLDDGFQHLRLARDLDVLCLGSGDQADWPLPAGRLREFARAAARADVRVRVLEPGEEAVAAGVLLARRRPLGFSDRHGAKSPQPRRAALLSALARPDGFEADVRALGIEVVAHARHRDHHRFTVPELRAAEDAARAGGADAVVTTAKDLLRVPPCEPGLPLLVLESQLELQDAAGFVERLLFVARAA
jgi:tetraacyldisaccharide 4'-kinase